MIVCTSLPFLGPYSRKFCHQTASKLTGRCSHAQNFSTIWSVPLPARAWVFWAAYVYSSLPTDL
jgi:hypothetical protein